MKAGANNKTEGQRSEAQKTDGPKTDGPKTDGPKTDGQDWRNKYFDSLTSLENEQKKFQAIVAALKRLSGRLCVATMGQSPRLDDEIKKLQAAIRHELTIEEIDKITTSVTDAVSALDQPVKGTSGATPAKAQTIGSQSTSSRETISGDEAIRSVLAALLTELRRDAELVKQVDVLDVKLATAMTQEQLPEVLASLTEIVGQRIQRIERAKQELEALLSQMVGKLDEIGQFVADQNQNQIQSQASSDTLNIHLVGEMKAMGESVEAAADLQQIRAQVRGRIDTIGRHLQEFRQREAELSSAIRARNDQMAARVAELETEANRLHGQLKCEQRLSSLDALTKIPNRLAYEKRIEEELKRWQRFKQPTCIVAWDVDHFKRVNDTYGHAAGDRVLRAVAESLASRIRGTDFLARYGGEEFVMILPGTKLDNGLRVVDEMRVVIAKLPLHSRGTPLSLTISCGITALSDGDTAVSAFERADKALYQAKERGRNCCVGI